jgi:hypothetical protein
MGTRRVTSTPRATPRFGRLTLAHDAITRRSRDHDPLEIGAQAYEATFASKRLASLQEAARGLGYTLVEAGDPTSAPT